MASLLVAVAVATVLILSIFAVPVLHPILGTPLGFLDLVALVAGFAYVIAYRVLDNHRSRRRAA